MSTPCCPLASLILTLVHLKKRSVVKGLGFKVVLKPVRAFWEAVLRVIYVAYSNESIQGPGKLRTLCGPVEEYALRDTRMPYHGIRYIPEYEAPSLWP